MGECDSSDVWGSVSAAINCRTLSWHCAWPDIASGEDPLTLDTRLERSVRVHNTGYRVSCGYRLESVYYGWVDVS